MVRKAEIPRHVVTAALNLAATQGWATTTLSEIAEAAKVPLVDLYQQFPSKTAILAAFTRQIDSEVLAKRDPEMAAQPARERLFDVIMRRFDALAPYKEGVRAVIRDSACDPTTACWARFSLRRSMRWMLEAAGIGSAGWRGRLRVRGLEMIYLWVLSVWLGDESEDMARTMAALDRQLRRIDTLLAVIGGAARRPPAPEPKPA